MRSSGLSLHGTGGEKESPIKAVDPRGVFKAADDRFPRVAEVLQKETTVAMDGEIQESV